jgi:NAD(P)-dependent dehydrogenase (short-subunit alcohol dehydrogenase family)
MGLGRLEGFSTIVTGGASGMGRSTVELWLDEGASVIIADLNQANGEELVEEMRAKGYGDRVQFVRTDVSKEEDIVRVVETAVANWGKLDVMFNNAGIDGAFGPLTEIEVDRLPGHQACGAPDAEAGMGRLDHQHRFARLADRRRRPALLFLGQGGGAAPHPVGGVRAGQASHPGQRDPARHHLHPADAPR